jgi:glycosyltransferase involved in cell wall biosynthesis
MSKQPLVSILIPAYNAEKWLANTIVSALNQTWHNKEIIIVDDGSKDQTSAVAKRFESASVKVILQENRGASAARNRALQNAHGDYIQWLDADDLLAPDKIEQQLIRIRTDQFSSKYLYSSAFGRFYFRHQKAIFIRDNLWQDLLPLEWILTKLRENLWMSLDAWLISRELTEIAGPWNESLSLDDDGEYISRIVLASEKVVFVPSAKSYCRKGNLSSLSYSNSLKAYESLYTSIKLHIDRILELENTERTRSTSLVILQRTYIFFYPDYPKLCAKIDLLAKDLGGLLQPPNLTWKYALIRKVLGWRFAKFMKRFLPSIKILFLKKWDELIYKIHNNQSSNFFI